MQQPVHPAEETAQIRFYNEAGARVCATGSHAECGTDAMTSYIGDGDSDPSIRQLLPVEVVAAGLIRRFVPPGNVKTVDFRRRHGKEPLLN